jgi:alpha-beta hydrolase superfamily lysophospholipase
MKHTEGVFQGAGGIELYYQGWLPEANTRAVLAIVHGFGEHSGRYMNVVDPLTARGYAVYGFDLRGHGRSPGQRGHIDRWTEYREDVRAFLDKIHEQEPKQPVFLLGHSMGALIALDYILHHPEGLRGAIISGAPLEPVGVAKPYLIAIARLLSRVWPRCPMTLALETSAISRDPQVVEAYKTDPLVHDRVSARWGTESLATVEWVKAHPADVKLPILLIHGEADRINAASGSSRFFEAVTFPDKALKIYPGTYHEGHNDINHEQVVNDLAQWLDRHL